MEKRILFGSNIAVSQLGFGCSGLMGRLNLRDSRRLIDAAFDAGITHFDTARLYGYGEAEKAIAHILATRRNQITVATKVGILPPRRSLLVSGARAVARSLVALQPNLRAIFRRGASTTIQHGVFDVPMLRASLDTSLRELGVDQVDILLLHECQACDLEKPELLEFLKSAQREGKLKQYGIATTMANTEACLSVCPEAAPVVQIPSSIWDRNAERLKIDPAHRVITHSSLGARFSRICSALADSQVMRRSWNAGLDFDTSDTRALGRLFLFYAMSTNPSGVTLFSSTDPGTIVSNVRALIDGTVQPDQITALADLIAQESIQ